MTLISPELKTQGFYASSYKIGVAPKVYSTIIKKIQSKKDKISVYLNRYIINLECYTEAYYRSLLQNLAQKRLCPLILSIVEDFMGCAFFDYEAIVHKEDAVSDFPRKAHFVGHNDHCHAFFCEVFHDV